MATLQKLRDHGKFLAIVVGLALAAFILGDMINSGQSLFNKKKFYIAEVNGQPITYEDYQMAMDEATEYYKNIRGTNSLDEQTQLSLKTQVWDELILKSILSQVKEKTGLDITQEEVYDMVLGNNPAPIVQQIFVNPQTGRFDRNFAQQVLSNLDKDPKLAQFWIYVENQLKISRMAEKYSAMISKGLMTTNFEAENNYYERTKLYDLQVAPYFYTRIPDSVVTVTKSDIEKYYKKHKERFYQSVETRRILYYVFEVVPSKEDSASIYKEIEDIKTEFEKVPEDKIADFVNLRSDQKYFPRYFTRKELTPPPLDSVMFTAQPGYVYGPYLDGNYYKLARLEKRELRPDTVSVRHILISPQNKKVGSMERAQEIADSLVEVIKNGGDFAQLAKQYSDDPGSADKGGVYENFTEGQMVPEFNEFCFSHKKGDIGTVQTQFGVHIIEILDQKSFEEKAKVAFIALEILPSQETYDNKYKEAALFRSACKTPEDFTKIGKEKGFTPRIASNLTKGTYTIPGLNQPRNIVQWAFNAKPNEISNVFDLGNKYVVAQLVEVYPKGILPLESVEDYIKTIVLNEKKGQYIVDQLKKEGVNFNDLNSVAQKAGTNIVESKNVSFSGYAIAQIGYEPAIFGSLDLLKLNTGFGPVVGKNGVYSLMPTSITNPPKPDAQSLQPTVKSMTQATRSRILTQLFDNLKRDYDIQDFRTNFF